MAIISQKTWEKFTKEEKDYIRKLYKMFISTSWNDHSTEIETYKELFGEEKLLPIKTWKDIQNINEDSNFFIRIDDNLELSNKVRLKCIATLKIAKLIELGYGGIITDDEWKNNNIIKYYIVLQINKDKKMEPSIDCSYNAERKQFFAFHTAEQAEEFLSYPENVELINNYFMLD